MMMKPMGPIAIMAIASLALVVSASPLPDFFDQIEIENLNPDAEQYKDFCLNFRDQVNKEVDAEIDSKPAALITLLLYIRELGEQSAVVEYGNDQYRSFAYAFSTTIGSNNPFANGKAFKSLPQFVQQSLDTAFTGVCEDFNRFSQKLHQQYDEAKQELKGNVELEQLGCRTSGRVLRLANICEFAKSAVKSTASSVTYTPINLRV